jgi:hypothetical protein
MAVQQSFTHPPSMQAETERQLQMQLHVSRLQVWSLLRRHAVSTGAACSGPSRE